MEEIGVKDLAYAPSPSIEDKFDDASAFPGKQAKNAASHLMSILYVARLVRADVVTTTSFLARRVSKWTLNEDRRLKRVMQYIWHHLDLILQHALHPKDLPDAELLYFPDAELGGDALTTKATGGFWLELSSSVGRADGLLAGNLRRPATQAALPQIRRHGVALVPASKD